MGISWWLHGDFMVVEWEFHDGLLVIEKGG